MPIPIKLPGDKSDTSPSAPDEPKHIYEHCHKPMHGGICGQNFKDVHNTIDKTKLHLLQLMLLLLKQMTTDNSEDDIFAEVVKCVGGHDCMPNGDEEFDEIVWEMALAVKECSINNPEAKKSLVDGWVSMEDNVQCNNL
jgi:hypothetical protein